MILDPCLPALHHTAATLRAWTVWGRARPWWHAPVRALSGPCSRLAALALPLLAAPGAAGPAYAPAAPLPWIGAPGWVQAASLPFNEYAPGYGADLGWGAIPGLSAGSPYTIRTSLPIGAREGITPAAWANPASRQTTGARPELSAVAQEAPTKGLLPSSDTPTDVPEPAALALVLTALLLTCLQPRSKRL